jgi:hypothetical protein
MHDTDIVILTLVLDLSGNSSISIQSAFGASASDTYTMVLSSLAVMKRRCKPLTLSGFLMISSIKKFDIFSSHLSK